MSRTALVAPRPLRPSRVAPSAVAVERVLWLAAVDRCLRLTTNGADVVAAYHALRRMVLRHAPSLYEATPVSDARSVRWIEDAREYTATLTAGERAAVVVWAAVEAWTDAPDGRWSTLADVAATLAAALDAQTGAGERTGRLATKLRAAMGGAR